MGYLGWPFGYAFGSLRVTMLFMRRTSRWVMSAARVAALSAIAVSALTWAPATSSAETNDPSTPTPVTTAPAPTAPNRPTPTKVGANPVGSGPAVETGQRTVRVSTLVGSLKVVEERAVVTYRRSLYRHWVDSDDDSCDTRREVLAEESSVPLEVCWSRSGSWVSVYDSVSVTDASELDIDHVVALAEAHRSGADRWPAKRRESFANDLGSPWSLVAVTALSNRSKSDHDLSSWQPTTVEGKCFLASATVITKWRWRLSVDRSELTAIRKILKNCADLEVAVKRA